MHGTFSFFYEFHEGGILALSRGFFIFFYQCFFFGGGSKFKKLISGEFSEIHFTLLLQVLILVDTYVPQISYLYIRILFVHHTVTTIRCFI